MKTDQILQSAFITAVIIGVSATTLAWGAPPDRAVVLPSPLPVVADNSGLMLALLRDIRSDALRLRDHADEIEISAMDKEVSLRGEMADLTHARQEINAIDAKLFSVGVIRSAATPSEQIAIDRVELVLPKMMFNVNQAIRYARENGALRRNPKYLRYASRLSRESADLAHVLRNAAPSLSAGLQ